MNNNMKIVIKIIIVVVILFHLPLQKVYSEQIENVMSTLTTTNVKKQSNGKSIHIYNTHQGERYVTKSVKEGSRYLMQLLQQRGYDVDLETSDFELYKIKNNINYKYSYSVSKKYLNTALKKHGQYDMVIDFHRDSVKKSLTTVHFDNKPYAKFLFVVGKVVETTQQLKKCHKNYLRDLIKKFRLFQEESM